MATRKVARPQRDKHHRQAAAPRIYLVRLKRKGNRDEAVTQPGNDSGCKDEQELDLKERLFINHNIL